MMEQAAAFRLKVRPFANRLLFKHQAAVFYAWVGVVAEANEERSKARLAVGLWAGKLNVRCFFAWRNYTGTRQKHRRDNETAEYRNAVRLASSHLDAWRAKWEAKEHERQLMRRGIAFLTNRDAMRCMNTWRSQWEEGRRIRDVVGGAYARWRKRELHAAWNGFVGKLDEEAERIRKAHSALSKLMNRALTRGFMGWVEMADERIARLEAMRRVGESLVNRGKRQSFNTLVAVRAYAHEWRRRRNLIQLREVRHIFGRWGALGAKRRQMVAALRRLTSREMTRGWMKWVLDWRHARDVIEKSMGKARLFVGRAMHWETARGFSSMRAAYERVLELRVMLRRVQNPRAIGMLRRWLTLATGRKEQLRKLRSAYAMISNGVLKRVVVEWRRLVAKRQIVKRRVALLLGRMLDASFHGWLRYASKRVARAAGERCTRGGATASARRG